MSVCHAETSQLLLVDLQTRLFAAMSESERVATVRVSEVLSQAATKLGVPIHFTEQYPRGLGTTDSKVLAHLPETAHRFEKSGFSCCAAEGFTSELKRNERRQIVMVGQEAHVCVLQTAFDLLEAGYRVFVVGDGVCSRNPEHKRNALARMEQAGIVITNAESVLFEWLRDASHPNFKSLSGLIR